MTSEVAAALEQTLIGSSYAIQKLRELITRIAPYNMPVLVLGETGTGKELVARALHLASGRSGELTACNVAALSDTLFEDALFGHERGAFSGADRPTDGFVARADRGTLFLDEISALPVVLQAKLLRVIELGEYTRVGSTRVRHSNFRLVTAGNESLERLVGRKAFRDDLAHRLRGTVIVVPPLRQRLGDIPELTRFFASLDRALRGVTFTTAAIQELQQYHWPGNVRQLRYVLSQAAIISSERRIGASEARLAIRTLNETPTVLPIAREQQRQTLQQLLEEHVHVGTVAAILECAPSTVYRRMRDLGIEPPERVSARLKRNGRGCDPPEPNGT